MSDMKDNRGKGILLLGLLINLTACQDLAIRLVGFTQPG